MMQNISFVILIITCLPLSQIGIAYKILVVFPFPSKSHNNLGEGVVKHLLEAGHDVTYVTPFPREKIPKNLTQISVSSPKNSVPTDNLNIKKIMDKQVFIGKPTKIMRLMNDLCEETLTHDNMNAIFDDNTQKFDVVVVEWMFNDVYAGLGPLFDCPLIWVSSVEPHWAILMLVDQVTNPSYVPNVMSTEIPPFSFQQRIVELFMQSWTYLFKELYLNGNDKELYTKLFKPLLEKKGKSLNDYYEVKYNASLVIGNSHVSLGQAMNLPQNYKAVGGYHVDTNVKPLPNDLQKIMDNAKNGVIYFSMGSNLKSKDLPEELKLNLLKMFGSLKQTVLWKFEEVLKNMPNNVHILHWAPQTSILSHPNCRIFITHGGLLSTIETVHFGKPIIGIPVFGDQFNNVQRAVKRGFAKMVTIAYDMHNELKVAIDDILTDPKYAEKAKQLSQIYHDRPTTPGKELVHWVEHVVRTRGAAHLRSPALLVPWYQKVYLDFSILVLIVLTVIYKVIKRLFKLCLGKKKSSTSQQDNEKKKK